MPTINFYLDSKKYRDDHLIFLYFRFNRKTLKYNTGLRIEPKFWDKDRKRATRKYEFNQEVNSNLADLESVVYRQYLQLRTMLKREPETKELKKAMDTALNRNEKQEIEFHKFVEQFLKRIAKTRKPSLVKHYRKSYNNIKRFEEYRKKKITFESVTASFNNDFVDFLHTERGLASNTVGNTVKHLKLFMSEATEKGINKNLAFRKFKVSRRPSESAIYLNVQELDTLMSMDLSDNKRLEKVRDFFLVGCYTGLRYNDLKHLSKANIFQKQNKKYVKVLTSKTNETVIIPMHENIELIMSRYDGEFPPSITNQKLNLYLKELGELAGITKPVEKIIIGVKRKKSIVPKYQLISTHTARRSFATNAVLSGLAPLQVMKMTGHKSLEIFEAYIRTTIMENAMDLSNHEFFQNNKTSEEIDSPKA